jgi:hypothetical protein
MSSRVASTASEGNALIVQKLRPRTLGGVQADHLRETFRSVHLNQNPSNCRVKDICSYCIYTPKIPKSITNSLQDRVLPEVQREIREPDPNRDLVKGL